jgi:hypothetical protein
VALSIRRIAAFAALRPKRNPHGTPANLSHWAERMKGVRILHLGSLADLRWPHHSPNLLLRTQSLLYEYVQ